MSTYLEMADTALGMGRPDEAELLARRVLVHEPASADALRTLAAALLVQGRRDEALTAAREAVTQRPDDWRTHLQVGWVLSGYQTIPHLGSALASARRAWLIAPLAAAPYALASSCYSALEKLRPARRALATAVRLDPDDPALPAAMARYELARRKLGRAGRLARGALSRAADGTAPDRAEDLQKVVDAVVVEQVRDLCLAVFVLIGALFSMSSEHVDPLWRLASLGIFTVAVTGFAWWVRRGLPTGLQYWPRGLLRRASILDRGLFVLLPVLTGFAVAAATVPDSRSRGVAHALALTLPATGLVLVVVALFEVGAAVRRRRRLPPPR